MSSIEKRQIWVTTALNEYLHFLHVEQDFKGQRHTVDKPSGKETRGVAWGITSKTPFQAKTEQVLRDNREHWSIENGCHDIIDWNDNEDRSRIRTSHGCGDMTRVRRFAIGIIKGKGVRSVAQKMRELTMNTRMVFNDLKMTQNSCSTPGS